MCVLSLVGEKFGSKRDGTEWRERWGEGEDGRDAWIDKSWKEVGGEGRVNEWGETEGSEGCKRWSQKWWRKHHGYGGDEFVEKWEDDGRGSQHTLKEGSSWK